MHYGSYQECRDLEKTHICTECRNPLVAVWGAAEDSYAVGCGRNKLHVGFTRVKSLTELRREGVPLPLEIEQQFQRKEQREVLEHLERGEQALNVLLPKEDSATSNPLVPMQLQIMLDYADLLGLNAYLGHVDIYQGRPRVTIFGRYFHALRQPAYRRVQSRPLSFNERKDQMLGDTTHAWRAEVIDTDEHIIGIGFGYSLDEQGTQLQKGVSEKWATPQRRAEKRAEEDALSKAFPLGIGVVEEREEEPKVEEGKP